MPPDKKVTVSVVIPVFNGQEFLEKNLHAVLALGADEVIVVDDASSDGSADFIRKNYSQIKLVQHPTNTRFPTAVNDGFKQARGDVVVLLNQDVRPDKELLKYTLPHFSNSQVFAVTFNEQVKSWAKAEFKRGFLGYTNGPKDNQPHESFWASGGGSAFRKILWDKLGGFDPIFSPGYFEDLDLGWRAHNLGYQIVWEPKCKIVHEGETSIKKEFNDKKLQQIKERNYLLAHWKNLQPREWPEHLKSLFLRIIKSPGYIVPATLAICRKLVS